MKKTGLLMLILLFISGCSLFKKDEPAPDEEISAEAIEEVSELEEDIGEMPEFKEEKLVVTPDVITIESFYPIKKTLEDLRREVNELKARIVEYESTVSVPSFNPEVLKMIKTPHLKHRITLTNGTVIRGTILKENTDRMTVETQLGQLTLDKGTIEEVNETAPPTPDVQLVNDLYNGPEKLNNGLTFLYSGTVVNNGLDNADFVRVICKIMGSDTDVIALDSGFVDGSLRKYTSGVISDCTVRPGERANFTVLVNVPKDAPYQYETCKPSWSDL